MIRIADEKDIDRIAEIYSAIHSEEESGRAVIGWDRNVYPTRETAETGVSRGDMYVMLDGEKIVAAGMINPRQVSEYRDCNWKYTAPDDEIMVLHTLVVDPKTKGKGCGAAFVKFYEELAVQRGCTCLRIDTQEKNLAARTLYKKLGFREAGMVYCNFSGIPDVRLMCLEKKL